MKEVFVPKVFKGRQEEALIAVRAILDEYAAAGFDLTLRQVYYQVVARQPFAWEFKNEERSYKWLGGVISDARLAGFIDWNRITDRTRGVKVPPSWDSPGDIVNSAAYSYRIDKWQGQNHRVEVWVEKDALVGVIGQACEPWRLPYLSCRGYTSQSELYRAGKRLAKHCEVGRKVLVLHLGDHDPSGIDMSRDIRDRVLQFARYGEDDIEVRRIALTKAQVDEVQPPPNPTKLTDSRAGKYVEEHGNESWELDALSPTYIAGLIASHVQGVLDMDKFTARGKVEDEERAQLSAVASRWEEVPAALGLDGDA